MDSRQLGMATYSGEVVVHAREQPDTSWEAFCSLQSHLQDVLDCVLLAAWLFVKIKPWGPGESAVQCWLPQKQRPLSYEVEKLKNKMFRTMRNALESPDMPWNSHLLDAMAIIKCVTAVTEGWESSNPHSNAYKKLSKIQITRKSLTKEAFTNSPLSQAWDSVLDQTVQDTDRPKCRQVIQMFLSLMRSATWDSVSRLTHNFTKPLEHAAVVGHTISNTRVAFYQGYGAQIMAIYTAASSIGEVSA